VLVFNPEVLLSVHCMDLEIFICCQCTVMFRKPYKGTMNLKLLVLGSSWYLNFSFIEGLRC
jgi:hypothetical protein